MELCECSLHDVIAEQQQRIPYTHQVRIVRELSEAVAFLHEHQIVHRDVRPKNILFKQGGYEGMVKLTDLGLSKEVDTTNLDESFSTTTAPAGTEVGSFGYYAPEHYKKGKPTAKVDIFSLGCCIFYVFSHGRRPFEDPREPDNKVLMSANIQIGRSNVKPVQHIPEVADMVTSMIDVEAKIRPSTAQVLEHPLFWSDETRFQFLCAVGKEADVMSSSAAARLILPPSLLKQARWSDAIDKQVWVHYTSSEQGRNYNTASTTHLLRFLRNCEAHPPPPGSPAQTVLVAHGGMASYFCSCFPHLALAVRTALAADEEWCTRSGLSSHMQCFSHPSSLQRAPHQQEARRELPLPLHVLAQTAPGELEQWLVSIHPAFRTYAAALIDYGYEDLDFLREADEEDFTEALTQVGMVKPAHRTRALKHFRQLKE
jgi:serine/threonine-protein kinase/endoribonuclease IRE1